MSQNLVEERPFEPLNMDPARWDPDGAGRRFLAINNALMERYRKAGEARKGLAGSETRKGEDYKTKRGDLYILESEIEALQRKYETLKSMFFVKTAELKHLMG
jgi:hypothetical protein